MEIIKSGHNVIDDIFIDSIDGLKLSEIPNDAVIYICKAVSFDHAIDLVLNLRRYDEEYWITSSAIFSDINDLALSMIDQYFDRFSEITDKDQLKFKNYHTIGYVYRRVLEIGKALKNPQNFFLNEIENMQPVFHRAAKKILLEIENFSIEYNSAEKIVTYFSSRTKTLASIKEKIERKNISIDEALDKIDDIAGVRIVCKYIEDVYLILNYFKEHPHFKILSIDDKIEKPDNTGYRAIHFICETSVYYNNSLYDSVKVECQIRTSYQESWALKTHELIYKKDEISKNVVTQIKLLSDLLNNADQISSILKKEVNNI